MAKIDFWCIDIIRFDMHPLAHGYKKVQSYHHAIELANELVKNPFVQFVSILKNGEVITIIN